MLEKISLTLKKQSIMDCTCPKPTSLTDIPNQDCGVNLKQIQRLAFQRGGNQFGTGADPANNILELADWQALMTATDDKKIIVTPLIAANPIIEAGEPITNGGGDNSTLNGVEEIEGVNPSNFSAEFKELSPEIEKALKAIICEKDLTVYFILQGGKIAVVKIDDENQRGFQIQSPFVSDRNNAGFATKDIHNIRFSLPSGWSEDLQIVTPNFNPLTQLRLAPAPAPAPQP